MKIHHIQFGKIASTNTWAKEHAQEFDPAVLTLVTASEQTAGRGRFKRCWQSPAALNIYASFCHFVESHFSGLGHIPQLLALAALEVLESVGLHPTLKWPNDVLVEGRKIAGILCETTTGSQGVCVISGIGLNVNMTREELLKIDRPATSLLMETEQEHSVEEILLLLTHRFVPYLIQFKEEGFGPFFDAFKRHSYLKIGQKICFHNNQRLLEGNFWTLNADGSVTIQMGGGELETFHAGEFL